MRHQRFLPALLLVFAFLPQARAGLLLQPQSRLWLEGDSTLHRYASTATEIHFSAEASSAVLLTPEALRQGLVSRLRVSIPVEGLKSGKSGLDGNLRRALKSGEHPEIVFAMAGYRIDASSAPEKISAWGTLSVAGVEKPLTLDAALAWRGGRAFIDGEQPLLMSDFGVKPPKLMMGALRTDDRVVVRFHLELEPDNKIKEEL